MLRTRFVKTLAIGTASVATMLGVAVAGAGQAAADPTVCITGPFGHVTVCNPAPDRRDWHDRPRWRDHWDGRGHWR